MVIHDGQGEDVGNQVTSQHLLAVFPVEIRESDVIQTCISPEKFPAIVVRKIFPDVPNFPQSEKYMKPLQGCNTIALGTSTLFVGVEQSRRVHYAKQPNITIVLTRMSANIVVFLGSQRDGRNAIRVGKVVERCLKKSSELEVTVLDPTDYNVPVVKQPLHFMSDASQAPSWMLEVNTIILNADGYVVVTPEYNCAVSPALSNFMDHFPPSIFKHKPCSIVTYSLGIYGGIRAATLARPHLSEFGMVTLPTQVSIPKVTSHLNDQGEPIGDEGEKVCSKLQKVADEVTWYTLGLKKLKTEQPPPL
ncbi:unnamed protein product [Cyprideis torosa]|uniref:NADPH-dependent FMN reductase-like domain-containing protein n=1 Tax=Cyprideis torosa TaxID=163714 RepID=A0A7R8ZFZ9_9CRUS|nr:unnamed protein product [Cyprideis torosa]CAG0878906.1 unnamed protein product [Cyprideis torosa]